MASPCDVPFARSSHESLDLRHLCHRGWAWDLLPVLAQSTQRADRQAQPAGSSSSILIPTLSPCSPHPGCSVGATYLEAKSRSLVLRVQAGAHAGVCPSEPSGRAVGVSQQQLLSLKERGEAPVSSLCRHRC